MAKYPNRRSVAVGGVALIAGLASSSQSAATCASGSGLVPFSDTGPISGLSWSPTKYFLQTDLDSIRTSSNPAAMFSSVYWQQSTAFKAAFSAAASQAGWNVQLSEDGWVLAFATMIAHEILAYGSPPPAIGGTTLVSLLSGGLATCGEYCDITAMLFRQARPASGVQLHRLGWNTSGVGSHNQLWSWNSGTPMILDPTLGLVCPMSTSAFQSYRTGSGTALFGVRDQYSNSNANTNCVVGQNIPLKPKGLNNVWEAAVWQRLTTLPYDAIVYREASGPDRTLYMLAMGSPLSLFSPAGPPTAMLLSGGLATDGFSWVYTLPPSPDPSPGNLRFTDVAGRNWKSFPLEDGIASVSSCAAVGNLVFFTTKEGSLIKVDTSNGATSTLSGAGTVRKLAKGSGGQIFALFTDTSVQRIHPSQLSISGGGITDICSGKETAGDALLMIAANGTAYKIGSAGWTTLSQANATHLAPASWDGSTYILSQSSGVLRKHLSNGATQDTTGVAQIVSAAFGKGVFVRYQSGQLALLPNTTAEIGVTYQSIVAGQDSRCVYGLTPSGALRRLTASQAVAGQFQATVFVASVPSQVSSVASVNFDRQLQVSYANGQSEILDQYLSEGRWT